MKLSTLTPLALSALALLSATAAYAAPFKIAISNSYIGNEWRVEMISFMQAYAKKLGADKVTLTVDNSGTDAPKQIQAISDMIASGANAIMINPASDTALELDHRGSLQAEHRRRLVRPGRHRAVRLQHRRRLRPPRRNPCAVDGRHAQG